MSDTRSKNANSKRKLAEDEMSYQSGARVIITGGLKTRPEANNSYGVEDKLQKVNKAIPALGTFGREKAGDTVKTSTQKSNIKKVDELSSLRESTRTINAEAIIEELDKSVTYTDNEGNTKSLKDVILERSGYEESNQEYYDLNSTMAIQAGIKGPNGILLPKKQRGHYTDAQVEQLKENWNHIKVITGFDMQFKIRFEHYVLADGVGEPAPEVLVKSIDGYSQEKNCRLGSHTLTMTVPVQRLEQISIIFETVSRFVQSQFNVIAK